MGKSITLPETRLGSLAGDTLATLPELGKGCFCPRGTWSCRAVSWLLAQRYRAESVSSKEPKFSSK